MGSFGGGGRNVFNGYGPWSAKGRPGWLNNAGNQVYGWGEQHGLDPLGGDKFVANGLGFQDPRVIKQRQAAQVNAQTQGNLAAQRGMSSGLMGGAQAGGQIQAYNSVLADAADQRTQLAQADQQSSMQNIGMLMSILGML